MIVLRVTDLNHPEPQRKRLLIWHIRAGTAFLCRASSRIHVSLARQCHFMIIQQDHMLCFHPHVSHLPQSQKITLCSLIKQTKPSISSFFPPILCDMDTHEYNVININSSTFNFQMQNWRSWVTPFHSLYPSHPVASRTLQGSDPATHVSSLVNRRLVQLNVDS